MKSQNIIEVLFRLRQILVPTHYCSDKSHGSKTLPYISPLSEDNIDSSNVVFGCLIIKHVLIGFWDNSNSSKGVKLFMASNINNKWTIRTEFLNFWNHTSDHTFFDKSLKAIIAHFLSKTIIYCLLYAYVVVKTRNPPSMAPQGMPKKYTITTAITLQTLNSINDDNSSSERQKIYAFWMMIHKPYINYFCVTFW